MSDTVTVRLILPRETWRRIKGLVSEINDPGLERLGPSELSHLSTLEPGELAAQLVEFALGHLDQHPEDWKEAIS